MFHIGLDFDYIPGLNDLGGFPPFLVIPFAAGYQQNLSTGMLMSIVSGARLKGYIPNRAIIGAVIGSQHFQPRGANEIAICDFVPFRENDVFINDFVNIHM
jgi:hypothetical protein